jgi:hypothetical protein
MAKSRGTRAGRRCAVVAEDGDGGWVVRGAGRRSRRAGSAAAAILQALYGERPVGAVVLVPPKGGR